MDTREIYDMVMNAERQENLRDIEQNNKEREQYGNKDYLSAALETSEKFNLELQGEFDMAKSDVDKLFNIEQKCEQHNLSLGRASCENILKDSSSFPDKVFRPVEPSFVKTVRVKKKNKII